MFLRLICSVFASILLALHRTWNSSCCPVGTGFRWGQRHQQQQQQQQTAASACAAPGRARPTSNYMVIGSCIYGPTLFYFYRALDRALPAKTVVVSLQKALIDQSVLSSSLLVAFYTAMSAMEGKEDIFAEMKAKWWPTYKLSCFFWIPVQCCNFLFMPPAARVVTVGVCSFVWVNILCVCKRNTSVPGEHVTSTQNLPSSAAIKAN